MATGIFGKLPGAGDFVARGLSPGLQPVLDRWLTLHFAALVSDPVGWPDGGVRAVLGTARGVFFLLIEPSADSVGRPYPLVACVPEAGAGQQAADAWADAVWPHLVRATEHTVGIDALFAAVSQVPDPAPEQGAECPPLPSLWWAGARPEAPELLLPRLARISSG